MKNDYFLGLSTEGFHKITYLEWGQPSEQPPILCVHGLSRHSRDFDALATYLSAAGQHVFCPDVVGRGDSDWLKDPLHYTYEQYLADLNVMIARMRAPQIHWIGTSMGGLLGLMLAALPQSPIRKLVLNDIGAQISVKGLTRLAGYLAHDPIFTTLEAAKTYYQSTYKDFGNLTDAQWDYITTTSVKQLDDGRYIAKYDPGIKLSHSQRHSPWQFMTHPYKALEGTLFDVDLWDLWRKVTCPVLVIHGEKSDILTSETITKMRSIHPDINVHTVPNVGHAPALLDTTEHAVIYHWLTRSSCVL